MNRRTLLKNGALLGVCSLADIAAAANSMHTNKINSPAKDDRTYWVNLLYKIARPVLENLSSASLKKAMPVEVSNNNVKDRMGVTHLEAVARTLVGLAPWLALKETGGDEKEKQQQLLRFAQKGLENAVNPSSPDYLNFRNGKQPLVDGAFLSHAFLRAPSLWQSLSAETKQRVIIEIKFQRNIEPFNNNWLLFAAMNEAFLLSAGVEHKTDVVEKAFKAHESWYKGDGWFGDGPSFHLDYYNSFVIQPMMVDILSVLVKHNKAEKKELELAQNRMKRYGRQLELLISPQGTYPPIGRSVAYRIGAFQALSQLILQEQLPTDLSPGAVRSALTAVLKNQFEAKGTFDENGWLQLGFCGHQPKAADSYISTGSLYLCSVGFLPLGLPANHIFWTAAKEDWSQKKAWSGKDFKVDKAIEF